MKKIVAILLLIIICLSITGCDLNIKSVDMLMHPPKLSGENSLLQQTFEEYLGNNGIVLMKTPISGDNRSSYLLYDLDCDSVREALVLYSDTTNDNLACVSVFKFQNDNWNFVSTIKGKSEEIYAVDFSDINGDGIYEILISWFSNPNFSEKSNTNVILGGSNSKSLSLYSYNGSSVILIKTEIYSKFLVEDLNNDGAAELFILNINFSNFEKQTSGRIISFDNNYSITNDISFNLTGMTDVYNIVTDSYNINDVGHSRIYIDGSVSETGYITEVIDIVHSSFEVAVPFYNNNISSKPLTLRDSRIYSQDIDDDGLIEIPTLEQLVAGSMISDNSENNSSLNLTVWSKIDNNELIVETKCLLNGNYGYMFVFPSEWIGKITAVYNESNNTLTFYQMDENQTLLNALFALRTVYKADWEENNFGYTKFDENSVYVYGYRIFDKDNVDNYVDLFNENFILINS